MEKTTRGHRGGQYQGQGRVLPQKVRKKDVRKKGRVNREVKCVYWI